MAYNVIAKLNGEEVKPNGEVTISFKKPENFGDDIGVYNIVDGKSTKIDATISEDGQYVTIKTSTLGAFAICDMTEEGQGGLSLMSLIPLIITAVVVVGLICIGVVAAVLVIVFIKRRK